MNIKQRRLILLLFCAALSYVFCSVARPAWAQFERPREQKPDASAQDEPTQPRMEMPKLLQFVSAEYPEKARLAGLTASVILILTIDETGKVIQADVTDPVGNGFDEAARDAALHFTFRPAKRNGVPVKVKIEFKYSFTLTSSQMPESAREPSHIGSLNGVLRIAGTEVPLAGVRVTVTGPGGFSEERQTDEQGRWQLESVKPGHYRVSIAAAAYNKYTSVEEVLAGEATDVTYYLSAASDKIEVTVTGERPQREVTRHTIERREIERIPGTNGDALRSIESMPGVARAPFSAGMLIVRGSYPDDTQVFVDGSGIPLIYHFVVPRSVVPSELLERIDFYPGNYSAQYGRGMGGIIDVGLRSPDTSCKGPFGQPASDKKNGCFHGLAALDLIEGRALLEGPLPVKGWSFAAGIRRSWLDAWMGPALKSAGADVRTLPVYYDWQLIAERKPTRDSRLSLRFIGSDDRYALVLDPLAEQPAIGGNLQFAQSFWTLQGLYEAKLAKTVSSRVMASVSRTRVLQDIGSWTYDVVTHPIQYRHEFGWIAAAGVKLNAGLDVEVIPYDAHATLPPTQLPGQADASPFANQQLLTANESRYGLRQAVYIDAELRPYQRWSIVPGLRLDYARDTRSLDPNPRLNTRYDLVPGGVNPDGSLRRRTTIKGGVGIYTQPPALEQTNSVFGTPGLVANRSIHYSLGGEQVLTRNIDLSLEGFYKDLERLVAGGADPSGARYTNLGSGSVIGLETLIKYKPDDWFFGWFAYTLSRSVRRDFPGDKQYLIPFDETHNLTVLGSLRLGRGWELGARFRLVSGHMTTPVLRPPNLPALYAADAGSYLPLQSERYSQRLPLVHQLDVRMDKHWQYRYWRFNLYVDVYNVYNNAAKEDLTYDYRYVRQGYTTGLPIYPNVGVRAEF